MRLIVLRRRLQMSLTTAGAGAGATGDDGNTRKTRREQSRSLFVLQLVQSRHVQSTLTEADDRSTCTQYRDVARLSSPLHKTRLFTHTSIQLEQEMMTRRDNTGAPPPSGASVRHVLLRADGATALLRQLRWSRTSSSLRAKCCLQLDDGRSDCKCDPEASWTV